MKWKKTDTTQTEVLVREETELKYVGKKRSRSFSNYSHQKECGSSLGENRH